VVRVCSDLPNERDLRSVRRCVYQLAYQIARGYRRGRSEVLPGEADLEALLPWGTDARRYLNAWWDADANHPGGPLLQGRWYTFYLEIGPRRTGAAAQPFDEPHFGGRESLELRVSMHGRHLDVERAGSHVSLPRWGVSQPAFVTRLRARRSGRCTLDIALGLAKELDSSRVFSLELDVAQEPSA
jgi:hypothetical protein